MLVTRPQSNAVLRPRLFGGVGYYATMASCGHAVVDTFARYDKRAKDTHRYTIADTRGVLRLTVPVGKPDIPGATWRDIPISDHGHWWNIHLTTLESAYGRTPFFEFYIDRFLPLFQPQGSLGMPATVGELIEASDTILRTIAGIDTDVCYGPAQGAAYEALPSGDECPEYYQVRSSRLGFIPDLSMLDLIFNMGPETPLVLRRWIQQRMK